MQNRSISFFLMLPLLLTACNAQRPALPDSQRPPNLIEMLCSCTNSEGQTMQEAARLYQESSGISWEEVLNSPPHLTEDWVRRDFFQDSVYTGKLRAITTQAKKERTFNPEKDTEAIFERAKENSPFCARQMRSRMVSLF